MKRYIVVDDDATSNLICKLTLNKYAPGSEVKLFQSPEEALQFIKEEQEFTPNILFLDINMPTMTGWEFLEEFSTLQEEIRNRFSIYMLSSSFEDSNDERKNYPFLSGFFSKPLRIEYLEKIGVPVK